MDRTGTGRAPTRGAYLKGLAYALVLTSIPFAIVGFKLLATLPSLIVIAVACLIQVGVHLRHFLHIDFVHTHRDNMAALLFTGFLIFIMVLGSLWIMFDLHGRMM